MLAKSLSVLSFGLALSLPFSLPANAQTAFGPERLKVADTGGGAFTVSGRTDFWARGYWCAAGDYAQRRLGLPVTARLYVAQPYQRGSRSIGFSTSDAGLSAQKLLTVGETMRTAGANLSVGQARSYCADVSINRGNR